MGFGCGLVGLPNAGKSTIFNALSGAGARVESYPFCTIEANVGTIAVPDERLDRLATLFPDKKKIPTHIDVVDIAGLVNGANEGEGMGNQFLSEIRAADAILHIVRCFPDPNVAHVSGTIDPVQDIEVVETELLLKDFETLGKVLERLKREAKGKDRRAQVQLDSWARMLDQVAQGIPLRDVSIDHEIEPLLRESSPLTTKPLLYVANVDEQGANEHSRQVEQIARDRGSEAIVIRGKIEAEIMEAAGSEEEREAYLQEWGLDETGLDKLITAGYRLLNLVTFFTVEGPEVRAWTVPEGTVAPKAGAKIHSDFEDRFVLAEVMSLEELLAVGSEKSLRDEGRVRRAGHEYVVQDGDVIHFICA